MYLRDEVTQGFPPPDTDLRILVEISCSCSPQPTKTRLLRATWVHASLLIVFRRHIGNTAPGGYDIPTLAPYNLRDQASHAPLVKDR